MSGDRKALSLIGGRAAPGKVHDPGQSEPHVLQTLVQERAPHRKVLKKRRRELLPESRAACTANQSKRPAVSASAARLIMPRKKKKVSLVGETSLFPPRVLAGSGQSHSSVDGADGKLNIEAL